MRFYVVGGWVRDTLMGEKPHDCDFVVVGADPEYFINLGYQQVGKDFPVFLEPKNKFEVALARVERKLGFGYKGFETDWKGVTLVQDLSRRDLTINAIAHEVDWDETVAAGEPVLKDNAWFIDPFQGTEDIKNKKLRPCTEAFKEDPLRVLRTARFLAKYPEFTITADIDLFSLDIAGELDRLSKERIWAETEKALKCKAPYRFFQHLKWIWMLSITDLFDSVFVLRDLRETSKWHSEPNVFIHTMMTIKYACEHFNNPVVNFACLMHDLGKYPCFLNTRTFHGHEGEGIPVVEAFCDEYRVPNKYKKVALRVTEHHLKVHNLLGRGINEPSRPKTIMKIFDNIKALTEPEEFEMFLQACESDAKGRKGVGAGKEYVQADYMRECLEAVKSVDTKAISAKMLAQNKPGTQIGEAIRVARIDAIRGVKNKWVKN